MPFNPSQPRNDNGEWTTTKSWSAVRKKRMTISQAWSALRDQGWELLSALPWTPGTKETTYVLKHKKTGKTIEKTGREIMQKVG